jgi:hypothetical protein
MYKMLASQWGVAHVKFVLDEVALEQIFHPVSSVFPC